MDVLGLMALPSDGDKCMYHATFDDFGTCELDGIRGFAGYVATDQQWRDFNRHWDGALAEIQMDFLHTAEYLNTFTLIGDKPKTDEDDYLILSPFINVVRTHIINPGGFGVIIVTECAGYDALSKGEKAYIRKPLINSFESFIGIICSQVSPSLGRHNPIAFQVDETDVAETTVDLLRTFIALKKQNDLYRKSLGGICFVDDKMHRPAQAADMLANLALKGWRKHKQNQVWPIGLRNAIARDDHTPLLALSYDEMILKGMAESRKQRAQKGIHLSEFEKIKELQQMRAELHKGIGGNPSPAL